MGRQMAPALMFFAHKIHLEYLSIQSHIMCVRVNVSLSLSLSLSSFERRLTSLCVDFAVVTKRVPQQRLSD